MPEYLIGVIIGLLIYSLILTIITLYKDNSSYFIVETLDVVVAGPVAWLLLLIGLVIIRPIYKAYSKNKNRKPKKYKKKSQRHLRIVVRKIVCNYAKKKYHNDYFDFSKFSGNEYSEYAGFDDILVKKARYEWINKQYREMIYNTNQRDEVIAELIKYFDIVTEEIMKQDDCNEWYISQYKDKKLYKIRTPIERR